MQVEIGTLIPDHLFDQISGLIATQWASVLIVFSSCFGFERQNDPDNSSLLVT